MVSFEEELKKTFVQEANQLLTQAEEDCLALGKGSHTQANIEKLFRLAHTFKGSANAVGFEALSKLGHHFENVLDKVMKGELKATPDVCAGILGTIDSLRLFVAGLDADLQYEFPKYHETISLLDRLLLGENPQKEPEAAPIDTPLPDPVAKLAVQAPPPSAPVGKKLREASKSHGGDVVRTSAQKLDNLINLISEIKVHRHLVTDSRRLDSVGGSDSFGGTGYIDKVINEVYDLCMSLRMTSIRPVFQMMQRVIWDSGMALGKEIQLMTQGEEVELDRVIVDKIKDPLTHLIRNAIDHGIESPEARIKKGKSKQGTITLSAQLKENRVVLSVSDDGSGLNRDAIRKKGIEKGLIQASNNLSDEEIYDLIFEPGFSTKAEVTELSGRGFGMDIVKESIQEIGGSVEIRTKANEGTTFALTLPLILSVIQGLLVELDQNNYIIPLSQIVETVDLSKQAAQFFGNQPVFEMRGEVVPIFNLSDLLNGTNLNKSSFVENEKKNPGFGVVIGFRGKKCIFRVDDIGASQPLALKSLGLELQGIPGISSTAILGDGEPALVLNLYELSPYRSTHVA